MVTTSCVDLTLDATLASIRQIRTEVADAAAAIGAHPKVVENLRLCTGEAVANVVAHAYRDEIGTVEVRAERRESEFIVVISDHGVGLREFELLNDDHYGVKIIATLADRYVISSAPDGGTRVRMVFSLDRSR